MRSAAAPNRVLRPARVRRAVRNARCTPQAVATSPEEELRSISDVMQSEAVTLQKVLCANRGEIAVRVFRAVSELGSHSVAIFSPSDRLQQHRFAADESFEVGQGKTPLAAYLDYEDIITVCKENGVDAVHPGYGFLSENADFVKRCTEEGIKFIGPKYETITRMGDKTLARALAVECGLPVVPGTDEAVTEPDQAVAFAEQYGFPLMLKAAMGGGGRGMRVVRTMEELVPSFERASSEAESAFGDGRMFIERFIEGPRHIEVQILADEHGNVVHLGERDCSVQRRHQKVVEMAPSANLPDVTRERLLSDAVTLARHVGYQNAGTVEFMVDKNGEHYFLEVNPRVQVEHTVTEEVTGVDIVQAQIRIAGGATLAELGIPNQDAIKISGFAIQCRVTTEDPEMNFAPDFGKIESYRVPGGMGIRLDGGSAVGATISPHYDSLLVKLVARGSDFRTAVQKMYRAINEFTIRGVKTNLPFLKNVFEHPDFLSGSCTTSFIDANPELFDFSADDVPPRMIHYLADVAVNGASHPGAVGGPCSSVDPVPLGLPSGVQSVEDGGAAPTGWRDILLADGPSGFAKAVRAHKGLLLTDTTWRDAHQSLLATRMRTVDLLGAAQYTSYSHQPFYSMEMWGGATFDVALRFLHECPWRRLEVLREQVPNVPFQMLLRGANAVGYTSYSDNVVREFVKQARITGVDVFRVFDSLNYFDNLAFGMDAVRDAGGVVEATICYSGDVSDPNKTKYTLDYYLSLTEQLVEHGMDVLCIKDMAGLLKPQAATMLVGAIRERYPDLPIHVHTHDTAATGVASMLACANAGADVVDVATDAFSGLTSQPSMGALTEALRGSEFDTGVDAAVMGRLNTYWEQTRGLYNPFESGLKSGGADVYQHEMPGGQYTNLQFQATSLGLAEQWPQVKEKYAAANRVLGDIIKVTPSSKVVGDLAQFMVQNELDEEAVLVQAEQLSFPSSVVEYMQGQIGQPHGGFPEPLRSKVLNGKDTIDERPGASMPDVDLVALECELKDRYPHFRLTKFDVLSAAIYPKVFDEYVEYLSKFGDLSSIPTRAFLQGLAIDEEIQVELKRGVNVVIKLKAVGELQPSGQREVFFEVNGLPRSVEVDDRTLVQAEAASTSGLREKSDPDLLGSVGAPMAGEVLSVPAQAGTEIKAGEPIAILSAMKMETVVAAPCGGRLAHVAAVVGESVQAGDLLALIKDD
mmetsp:Transcript_27434/g.89803  ORF Transcript_27434/g.89803 Transcript_27434/m.89803 type:complete len:1207 (+) Transcript_27434:1-3621(+)